MGKKKNQNLRTKKPQSKKNEPKNGFEKLVKTKNQQKSKREKKLKQIEQMRDQALRNFKGSMKVVHEKRLNLNNPKLKVTFL